jgi:hypothetical protein
VAAFDPVFFTGGGRVLWKPKNGRASVRLGMRCRDIQPRVAHLLAPKGPTARRPLQGVSLRKVFQIC